MHFCVQPLLRHLYVTRQKLQRLSILTSQKMEGLDSIVGKLRGGQCKVVVLTGAGMSCASGIPDFRSPGGMYDTLRPELITASDIQRTRMREDPTVVVDVRLFTLNQFPYLEVRRPFILGTADMKWKATLSHVFVKVLHDKGLLQRLYTQNIDGLDHQLSLPSDKIVNLHGSLAEIKCEFCGADYPIDKFREEVRTNIKDIYNTGDETAPAESRPICCLKCKRAGVKPATVMYGCELPEKVWKSVGADFPNAVDLLIVAGTSLTVSPACRLVSRVAETVPRVLINRDRVGEDVGLVFEPSTDGQPARDVHLQGDCDAGFLQIAGELGWVEDLRSYKHLMCPSSAALLDAWQNNP